MIIDEDVSWWRVMVSVVLPIVMRGRRFVR
jgi:hypothetical protein